MLSYSKSLALARTLNFTLFLGAGCTITEKLPSPVTNPDMKLGSNIKSVFIIGLSTGEASGKSIINFSAGGCVASPALN